MTKFKITSKEKHGNMPAGASLIVETPLTSCDADKIKAAIKAAGYDSRAQDATWPGYYNIQRL
jgi:hypothetical protein